MKKSTTTKTNKKTKKSTITKKRKYNGYYYLYKNKDHFAYLVKADDFEGWDVLDLQNNFMNDGRTMKEAIEKIKRPKK